jgi:cytoskeletal protein CcmA (bactofilin family)
VIGVGSCLRGTIMVAGTLRIDGEFEGDILNCERLEVVVSTASCAPTSR